MSDRRTEHSGRHVWKMCTTCESEPEPNHREAAGTRALKAPYARPPRRIWPTVDWPGVVAAICAPRPNRRADEARSAPGGGSRSCTGQVTVACAVPSAEGCSGPGCATVTGPDVRPPGPVVPSCAGALRRQRGAFPAGGTCPRPPRASRHRPAGRPRPVEVARGRVTLADNVPHRNTNSNHAFRHRGAGGTPGRARSRRTRWPKERPPLLLTFGWRTGRGDAPNGLTRRQVNVSADGWSVQASVTEICATCNTRRVCPVYTHSGWKVCVCGRRAAHHHRTPVHGPSPWPPEVPAPARGTSCPLPFV